MHTKHECVGSYQTLISCSTIFNTLLHITVEIISGQLSVNQTHLMDKNIKTISNIPVNFCKLLGVVHIHEKKKEKKKEIFKDQFISQIQYLEM